MFSFVDSYRGFEERRIEAEEKGTIHVASLNQMVGSDTNEQTYKKFGQQQIENMFARFGAPFSKANKVPAGRAREVTKMKRKHVLIVRLKAQAAAGMAEDGDEQKLNEAENPDDNEFVKTYKPIR